MDATLQQLKNGGVGVIPTDTIYGLVGQALNKPTVERIYKLKKRSSEKPFIILISSINDLEKFNISLSDDTRKILKKVWPGEVSVVLDCTNESFEYLHRGTKTLAFRLPNNKFLKDLTREVGPLVAPSANLEGYPNARNIYEAEKYFGDQVDFYLDEGEKISEPSTLIKITNGDVEILRQGKKTCHSCENRNLEMDPRSGTK